MRGNAPLALDAGRSFPRERLSILHGLEDWHFWFDGRRRLVERLLVNAGLRADCPVVEVGCGTGAMVRRLRVLGYQAIGLDPLIRTRTWNTNDAPVPVAAADGRTLPLTDGCCGAVVTLDVLEHTDDVAALAEAHRVIRPGGVLILTVPALPWLWSHHDDRAGHLRRYTRSALHATVRSAGFIIEESHYYQFALLPVLVVSRLLARWRRVHSDAPECPSPVFNLILRTVTRLEVFLGRWIAWPIGSTLALRCRRAAGA